VAPRAWTRAWLKKQPPKQERTAPRGRGPTWAASRLEPPRRRDACRKEPPPPPIEDGSSSPPPAQSSLPALRRCKAIGETMLVQTACCRCLVA